MATKIQKIEKLEILPVTPERWDDFETLFGKNGVYGCWCMWWRMRNREFNNAGKEGRKEAMRTIVRSGTEPGLLAYADGIPVGWVAVAPRVDYPRLETSQTLFPVDDQEVWSIACFFIQRNYRGHKLMQQLINSAVQHAREHGARIVEAYPLDANEHVSPLRVYTGITSIFERCGFVEVARREYRPILRKVLE